MFQLCSQENIWNRCCAPHVVVTHPLWSLICLSFLQVLVKACASMKYQTDHLQFPGANIFCCPNRWWFVYCTHCTRTHWIDTQLCDLWRWRVLGTLSSFLNCRKSGFRVDVHRCICVYIMENKTRANISWCYIMRRVAACIHFHAFH